MLHVSFERRLLLVVSALLVASATLAIALTPALSDQVRPLLQYLGISSCSGTNPCQTYSNTSSGAGVKGVSSAGNGVLAQTKFNSTSASNGKAGIVATDLSTSGTFNSAVRGSSPRGTGVSGTSTNGTGVFASSGSGTALISASTSGDAIDASSSSGRGVVVGCTDDCVRSLTSHNSTTSGAGRSGVFGQDISSDGGHLNAGVAGFSNNGVGVVGLSNNWVGVNVVGGTNTEPNGVDFFPALSIVGTISNSTYNALVIGCAPGTVNPCDSDHSEFEVDAVGGIESNGQGFFKGNLYGAGIGVGGLFPRFPGDVNITNEYTKSGTCVDGCAVPTVRSAGRAVTTYASMTSQPTVEDFGEAQLVDGQTYVHLDPKFANVIDQRSAYLVFITPEGDANVLYVMQKSAGGFAVRESHSGRSTIAFSYRIVAKPFGSHEARLPMIDLPRLRQRSRLTYVPQTHLRP